MTAKVIDFDQFRAEQGQEPVIFRIGGEEYKLPPTLPADIGVAVIRMQEDLGPEAKIPPQQIMDFCEAVFGEELWQIVLRKHRVTMEELPKLLYAVLQSYTEDDDEDPKEPASPTSPIPPSSSTSSKGGPKSKPTS
jgi:hypothetical protein